jgi:hypothetical protein
VVRVGQFYKAHIINASVECSYMVEVLDETLDVGAQGRVPLPALFLLSTPTTSVGLRSDAARRTVELWGGAITRSSSLVMRWNSS